MKKTILTTTLALAALVAVAKDVKTVVYTTTPQMHCESCENRIKKNVRFVKGVKLIETNIPQQTVTIQYDAEKTSPAQIEAGFKKIGYDVQQVTQQKAKAQKGGSSSTKAKQ